MKPDLSFARLIAALADTQAGEIEEQLGRAEDFGAAAHVLRQELTAVIADHVERVARSIVGAAPAEYPVRD